jgi:hypothetical protein
LWAPPIFANRCLGRGSDTIGGGQATCAFASRGGRLGFVTILDGNSRVQRLETLAAAPMGDELAMMDLDTGKYVVLDRVGAAVWDELAEPVGVGDLIDRLEARFEVTRKRCETDVLDFLRELHAKGLIRVAEA